MTALAEALLAAQRQAIGAASKAFVAGTLNETDLFELLDDIGARDTVEQAQLLASLHALQRFGASAPRATTEPAAPKMVSDAQLGLIGRLYREKNIDPLPAADLKSLHSVTASKLISALQDGSYDPADYVVPF